MQPFTNKTYNTRSRTKIIINSAAAAAVSYIHPLELLEFPFINPPLSHVIDTAEDTVNEPMSYIIDVNESVNETPDTTIEPVEVTEIIQSTSSQEIERILVFDVETTGFPVSTSTTTNDKVEQPYIIQLSFVIVNVHKTGAIVNKYVIEKQYNNYISIDSSIVIPEKITEITGITREMCDKEGIEISGLLHEFYEEYNRCQYIVSHNMSFDSRMMLIEFERNYHKLVKMGCIAPYSIFNPMFNNIHRIKLYCTMTEGKNITNLFVIPKNSNNKPYKKPPKLIELFKHLYPEEPEPVNLHNSLVDTLVCMKCFLKMKYIADSKLIYLREGVEEV